jgi:tetratricopeptide (TPR) repeat protein
VLKRTGNIKFLLIISVFALFIGNSSLFAQEGEAGEHWNAAIEAQEKGDLETAITEYEAAISADTTFVDPHLNLGTLYFSQKKYKNAVTHFQKATELDSTLLEGWTNLGLAATEIGNIQVGEKAFTKALKIKPNDPDLMESFALLYYKNNAYDRAIGKYEDLVKLKSQDKVTFYALGKSYKEVGNTEKAVINLSSATKIDPKYYLAHFELGNIYLDQKNYGRAIANYKKAVGINSKHYQSWFNLGSASVGESTEESILDAYDAYKKFLSLTSGRKGSQIKKMRGEAQEIVAQLKAWFDKELIEYDD